ncbi:MAG: glycosyltransferase [Pseudomonadota bacterium]
MIKVSVVIPYFQRQAGILRRAVESILSQEVPPNNNVEIIVVDDGSPISAQSELKDLIFTAPFTLNLIVQPNGGVAMARNSALKAINETTKYIAFLDSDDTWRQGHLNKALETLEQGADFYFCDNSRESYHDSYFKNSIILNSYIAKHNGDNDIVSITPSQLCTTILREFTTQASTVIYRRSIYPELLFDTSFYKAGEDVIFFLQLSTKVKNACFSKEIMVDCGTGINLYFSALSWDSVGHLSQIITKLRTYNKIKSTMTISKNDMLWNKALIKSIKLNIAFLALRKFFKTKGRIPEEIKKLAHDDKTFYHWFPLALIQVIIGKPLGIYKPD